MTLSQRLTRAGLAFILLGSVAAVLPQQNEAAMADNACTLGNHKYAIYQNGTTSALTTYHQNNGSTVSYTADLDTVPQGNIAGTPVNEGTVTASGATASVTTPADNDGANLSATYTDGDGTYTAMASVTSP